MRTPKQILEEEVKAVKTQLQNLPRNTLEDGLTEETVLILETRLEELYGYLDLIKGSV